MRTKITQLPQYSLLRVLQTSGTVPDPTNEKMLGRQISKAEQHIYIWMFGTSLGSEFFIDERAQEELDSYLKLPWITFSTLDYTTPSFNEIKVNLI